MLIRHDVLRRIASGEVTLAFRRWKRPSVKAGTRLRTAVGVLEITGVDRVDGCTEAEAIAAGFASRAQLEQLLSGRGDPLYRIGLRFAGPDPRLELRQTPLDEASFDGVMERLRRFDAASTHGPWTEQTLLLIADRPGVRAADLAEGLGRDKKPFKVDVRKLKELGLTESLETGYRLSPRGRSLLERWTR